MLPSVSISFSIRFLRAPPLRLEMLLRSQELAERTAELGGPQPLQGPQQSLGTMSTPLKTLPDVLQPILKRLLPTAPCTVCIESARGLMLVEPLCCVAPVPLRAIALRSGLAVASLDLAGASPHSPVMLARQPTAVAAGQALPENCDAVIDPASVANAGQMILVANSAVPAMNARLSGQDLECGAVIMPAAQQVTPETVLACRLAGVGMATVRRPTVSFDIDDVAHVAWLSDRLAALGCSRVSHCSPVTRPGSRSHPMASWS